MPKLLPTIEEGAYIFHSSQEPISIEINPIATFLEKEGTSYIIKKEDADNCKIEYNELWAWISIGYQSALNMVGLTALIANSLTAHQIPCNVVAAYHHDHLFVPIDRSIEAHKIIDNMRL